MNLNLVMFGVTKTIAIIIVVVGNKLGRHLFGIFLWCVCGVGAWVDGLCSFGRSLKGIREERKKQTMAISSRGSTSLSKSRSYFSRKAYLIINLEFPYVLTFS